jgi:hypothetical protein
VNSLFPSEIAADSWVLCHGTSSFAEAEIDAHGLRPGTALFERRDIQEVVAVFRDLDWYGRPFSMSRNVLEQWSLRYDLGHAEGKPTYLAASAKRAMTYATQDFAGGEAARAMRQSFVDLTAYLNDPSVREKHRKRVQNEIDSRTLRDASRSSTPRLSPMDLEWLEKRLMALAPIAERAKAIRNNFEHGVVYAVRLDERDLTYLKDGGPMGIKAFAPIEKDKLVAKVRILPTHKPSLGIDSDAPATQGIVARLQANRGTKR